MLSSDGAAGVQVDLRGLIRRPLAFLPLAMSCCALAMVLWFVALHGVERHVDESVQARVWLILVVGQVPLVVLFAYRWLPRAKRTAVVVVAFQVAAIALVAIAPLWILGGL